MRRRAIIAAALLVLGAAYFPEQRRAQGQAEEPLLVIIAASAGHQNIGFGTLRNVFEGYPTDFEGKRLIPFNYAAGTPARVRFDKSVLGLTPERAGQFWVDQRVRTGVQAPRTITSPELMLRVIASLPTGIGYVTMSPASVPAGIQILAIDGKKPTDDGYPL